MGGGSRDEYYDSKDNKMMSSIIGFLENYSAPPPRQAIGTRWMNQNQQQTTGMSPIMTADSPATTTHRRMRVQGAGSYSVQYGSHSGYRGQASLLLDRHHQPSASHVRTLRQSVYQHTNFN